MKVKISDNISFEYLEGEWHILMVKINKDKSTKEKTEYYGDINRCISALPKYNLKDSEAFSKLYLAYKKVLQDLLPIKHADISKVNFSSIIGQEFISYPDVSNSNIIVDFVYSTDHGMSESGIKKDKRYLTNFYQVALYILGIEVGERLRSSGGEHNVDDFISVLEETKESLNLAFLN